MKIIYLKPRSAFNNVIDSDMLWGIILTALNLLYGRSKTDEIVEQCSQGKPPFLLSDCFPYIEKNGKRELLFPKVILKSQAQNAMNNDLIYNTIKKFKKEKYISLNDFQDIINGRKTEIDLLIKFVEIKDSNEREIFEIKTITNTHTSIDRLTCVTAYGENDKGLLYTTDDTFIGNGGLYFLFEGDFSIIEPALNFLCHWGIAEDVSSGKGHFEISFEDFNMEFPENPTHFVTLSGYLPSDEEVEQFDEEHTHYELVKKAGKMSSRHLFTHQYAKDEVYFMAAGSSFPWLGNKVYGRLREVAKVGDMSIKFNGFAFAIPAILKES
jgi:CRISPR type III-A-associated RAMP protein Csm4